MLNTFGGRYGFAYRLLTRAARKTCGINNAFLSRDRKGAVVSAESPKVLSPPEASTGGISGSKDR